jgi:hypothetical protein
VDISRPREGETYRNVLVGATAEEKSFFPTVLFDGDVKLVSGANDMTLERRKGSPPNASFPVFSKLARSSSPS